MTTGRWTCCVKKGPGRDRRAGSCIVRAGACLGLALAAAGTSGADSASQAKLGADVAAGLYHFYEKTARVVPADARLLAGIAKAYQVADLMINVTKALRATYRYLRTREDPYRKCLPVVPARYCPPGDRACARCAREAERGYEYAWGWIQQVVENCKETADYVSRAVIFGDFGSSLPLYGMAGVFAQAAWKDQRKQIGAAYERYAEIYRRKLAEFLYELDRTYWRFSRCIAGGDLVERSRWYLEVGQPAVLGLGDCYADLPYRLLSVNLEFPPGTRGWRFMSYREFPMPSLPEAADGRGQGASSPAGGEGAPAGGAPMDLLGGGGTDAGTGAGPAAGAGGPDAGPGRATAQTRADGPQATRRTRRCEEEEGAARGGGERQECREDPARSR